MPACVVAAALGPADEREGLQSALAQPAALLACGEVDVGVRPLPRPVVLGPVEARGAEPVLQRQLVAVADAQPALFGAVDEEQPAERPERLTAEVGGVLLVDDQDAAAAFGELTGGDQARKARSDDDDISICHGRQCSGRVRRRRSARDRAATRRPRARTGASGRGRWRRAWPGAGPACAGAAPQRATRTMPARRAVRSADSTSVRHHHGSVRKPSPMPSTRARTVVLRTRSVIPLSPASRRKPLRGNASTVPCETVQPGAANSRVRSPRCSSTRSAPISRRLASCAGSVANSPRRFLVAASSKPCRTMASPRVAPRRQPFDGRRVLVEPVAALEPRRHEERGPAPPRASSCVAERVDVGQRAVTDPGDRDDQLSSHAGIVATSGVATVSDTLTAVVYSAIAAGPPRWPRSPRARRVRCAGGTG